MKTSHPIQIFILCGMSFGNILTSGADGGSKFKEATITQTKNSVTIYKDGSKDRPAREGEKVMGKDVLGTGKKSRAEVEFPDTSIARLGANTMFSFDSTARLLKLDQGVALIHVPPNRGGVQISTPSVTAAILGDTIAVMVTKEGTSTFISLSQDVKGPVSIQLVQNPAVKRLLPPGEKVTIPVGAKTIPVPEEVDIAKFVATFPLLDQSSRSLPATARKEIQQVIEKQDLKSGEGLKRPPLPREENRTPPNIPELTNPRTPSGNPAPCPTGG